MNVDGDITSRSVQDDFWYDLMQSNTGLNVRFIFHGWEGLETRSLEECEMTRLKLPFSFFLLKPECLQNFRLDGGLWTTSALSDMMFFVCPPNRAIIPFKEYKCCDFKNKVSHKHFFPQSLNFYWTSTKCLFLSRLQQNPPEPIQMSPTTTANQTGPCWPKNDVEVM